MKARCTRSSVPYVTSGKIYEIHEVYRVDGKVTDFCIWDEEGDELFIDLRTEKVGEVDNRITEWDILAN